MLHAPIHGDLWQVYGLSDGTQFIIEIRAQNLAEATAMGKELCEEDGDECVRVELKGTVK